MSLTALQESLLLAAYFRGGDASVFWISNSDQILTLSLFFTGDISKDECEERFSRRSYVGCLYDDDGELTDQIEQRYSSLIALLRTKPELIEGGGDFKTPADPTYTSCRLTDAGQTLARTVVDLFPRCPEFPNWPNKREFPNRI